MLKLISHIQFTAIRCLKGLIVEISLSGRYLITSTFSPSAQFHVTRTINIFSSQTVAPHRQHGKLNELLNKGTSHSVLNITVGFTGGT